MLAQNPGTWHRDELAAYLLGGLFEQRGYRKFRMSKFEEYDFYIENKDFLPGKHILTFTGLDGKLMALRPDVTMSIVKRTRATPSRPERLYYNERIYRASPEANEYREIPQMGAEYIGSVTRATNAEVASLALSCLAQACGEAAIAFEVSHMGYVTGLLDSIDAPAGAKHELMRAWESKNVHGLRAALAGHGVGAGDAERAEALLSLCCGFDGAPRVFGLARGCAVNARMLDAVDETEELFDTLGRDPVARGALRLDFSSALDGRYYNGLIFRGYVEGAPRAALIGGRYDNLVRRMAARDASVRSLEAIGFAVYVDELPFSEAGVDRPPFSGAGPAEAEERTTARPPERTTARPPERTTARPPERTTARPLRVALPKGRMGDKAYEAFAAIGHPYGAGGGDSRRLEIPDATGEIQYLLIKPHDVSVYVERGAADIGIVGKDVLLELGSSVYELLDLGFGSCALAVAAPDGYDGHVAQERALRVATKYVNVARRHFARQNQDIDVIKLNGSIELAPLLGLSDVIVDVVQTGVTLRENGLSVYEEIAPSSARLIANVGSYKFFGSVIDGIAAELQGQLGKAAM